MKFIDQKSALCIILTVIRNLQSNIRLFIYLFKKFVNPGIEFNASITQIQDSQ